MPISLILCHNFHKAVFVGFDKKFKVRLKQNTDRYCYWRMRILACYEIFPSKYIKPVFVSQYQLYLPEREQFEAELYRFMNVITKRTRQKNPIMLKKFL